MLQDIKYSTLKETYPVKYEIMQLRDLYGNTYADISRNQALSVRRVIQHYHYIKRWQAKLYIRHLAVVYEHINIDFFIRQYREAETCYEDCQYATAYIEKEYKSILEAYRDGEPGMPDDFLAQIPPFKTSWSEETIQKIIEMREIDKKTYIEIGRLLEMTKFKAACLYDWYYHEKFLLIWEQLKMKYGKITGNDIAHFYFEKTRSSKKRYAMICADYPDIIQ